MPAANKNDLNTNIVPKKLKQSTRIALSGIIAALSVTFMFLTGLIPLATYAIPALSGFFLVILVVETDFKTAMLAFFVTSILSILMTPDKEAALLFTMFFGHYGIVKTKLDSINSKFLKLIAKFLLFNICMIITYLLMIQITGTAEIVESFGDFGKYSVYILLALCNIFFILYDYTISSLVFVYIKVFRPRFFKLEK